MPERDRLSRSHVSMVIQNTTGMMNLVFQWSFQGHQKNFLPRHENKNELATQTHTKHTHTHAQNIASRNSQLHTTHNNEAVLL